MNRLLLPIVLASCWLNAAGADLPAPLLERGQTLAGLLSLADERLVSDKQLEEEIERAFQPPMAARTGRRTGTLAS